MFALMIAAVLGTGAAWEIGILKTCHKRRNPGYSDEDKASLILYSDQYLGINAKHWGEVETELRRRERLGEDITRFNKL